ncbi:hypothetical protein [Parasitella parasitica]|uniref:Uncharacterized protein n=1 Tax=Parasitella parasitica TaxID=35722 RepID=A0A0B7NNG7_9FUNG|nr:hypothetical protein [Parasitella parasitica]
MQWPEEYKQRRLVNWAQSQGIQVIADASFGNAAFEKFPPGTEHLENLMKHPMITVKIKRMKTNLDINNVKLDDQDLKSIDKLEANARFNDFFKNTYGFDFSVFA